MKTWNASAEFYFARKTFNLVLIWVRHFGPRLKTTQDPTIYFCVVEYWGLNFLAKDAYLVLAAKLNSSKQT